MNNNENESYFRYSSPPIILSEMDNCIDNNNMTTEYWRFQFSHHDDSQERKNIKAIKM